MDKIDRNKVDEIKKDIKFLDEIIKYVNKVDECPQDFESIQQINQLLKDWRSELRAQYFYNKISK